MRKTAVSILMCSLLCAAGTASAAGHMKAGLWEMTVKSDAMKNMPKIPPEQMEKMKQMGIQLPQMGNGSMVTKVCISKEMAERDHPPSGRREAGCTSKNVQYSGSSYSVDVVCDGPEIKGTGTTKGTFSSDGSFTSVSDFTGTAHGHPVNHHTEANGKWLSADCGDVKPMDGMMPKK
jgi:hypothetical protein